MKRVTARGSLTLLLASAAFIASCDRSDREAEIAASSDRAERRSVETVSRVLDLTSPMFVLGGADAPAAQAFGRVRGAVLDERDRLWVADEFAGRIFRFDASGRPIEAVGGKGRGPGEFLQVEILGWNAGSVVAWDVEQKRLTLVDSGGGTTTVPALGSPMWHGFPKMVMGFADSLTYVSSPIESPPLADLDPGWVSAAAHRIITESPGQDSASTVLVEAGSAMYFDGDDVYVNPLGSTPSVSVVHDTVVLVGLPAADVLVTGVDGRGTAAYDFGGPGLELTAPLLDSLAVAIWEGPGGSPRFVVPRSVMERRGFPSRMPEFDRVVGARDGTVWLRHAVDRWLGDRTRWEVLTLRGRHLGTVRLPSGERILAANEGRLATLRFDENDVATIAVYEHPVHARSP